MKSATKISESLSITAEVKKILSHYEGMNSGTRENLVRILMQGKLGGTGKLVILPVDQGFEHGPARSFAKNPAAYDPHYHYQLAIDAGLSAYAAPLGFLEAGMDTFAGKIPTILKVNSSNSLTPKASAPNQAVTGSVKEAIRLGCTAIGFTIYPGSAECLNMMEEIREMTEEAKAAGLVVVMWSYPRGADISKDGETAIDVTAYAAHMAALMGAHIIKVKPQTDHIEQAEAKKVYESEKIDVSTPTARFAHIKQCCFNGRRIVVFSGGNAKGEEDLLNEARAIRDGGGNGSIIGRNTFQRPRNEALKLLENMIKVYKGEM
ncbi:MAG: class I fructose-bisphosphate aldolase [Rickettsiales bacterium]|nr:class I fructose-bisphosphate aldolase [Rickettsiales bacterium]